MNKFMMMIALMVVSVLAVSVEMARAQGSGLYVTPKAGYSWGEGNLDVGSLGVALGYDFYQTSDIPVRVDLEYMYRFEGSDDWYEGTDRYESDVNWQTVMANVYYDFYNSSPVTPYINAGLGFAYSSVDAKGPGGSASASETDFAWSLGVGISYALDEATAIDVGYRYIEVDDLEFHANEANVGLRFSF